ncbi:MAG TPA: DUF4129 domain-containing protein, partial [Methanocella sp.]|nr:DUF4129 domain-containing protein [Methanocella sp.]
TVLIMPFDLPTALALAGIVLLAVAGLVAARVIRARRTTRKTPLPKPTLVLAPLPAQPAAAPPVTRFENEVARIDGIIAGGAGRREVLAEIYRAARRIAGRSGLAVPDSATHREFLQGLAAREPSLAAPAGTITKNYEAATFSRRPPGEQDVADSLSGLKAIDARMSGDDRGGSP